MRWRFLSLCTLLALSPPLAASAEPTEADRGAEQFQRFCAACHGADAKGSGPVAPSLRTRPPDLTRLAARSPGGFDAQAVTRSIDGRSKTEVHGSREMPVWGERFQWYGKDPAEHEPSPDRRIRWLVAYLRSIQANAKSAEAGSPSRAEGPGASIATH